MTWTVFFYLLLSVGVVAPDVKTILESINSEPASHELWLHVGQKFKESNSEYALDAFHISSLLQPSDPTPEEEAGLLLELLGDQAAARRHLLIAVLRGSVRAEVYYSLGNIRSARGHHQAAEAFHARAVELRQDYMEAHNNLASARIALANSAHDRPLATHLYREALTSLWHACSLQPTHPTPIATAVRLAQKTADFRYWDAHLQLLHISLMKGDIVDFLPWQASVFKIPPLHILSISRILAAQAKTAIASAEDHAGRWWQEGDAEVHFESAHRDCLPGSQQIRVGYLSCSGFMGNTTTANFIQELFELHDSNRFATTCYARGAHPFPGGLDGSEAQTRIRQHCSAYRDQTRGDVPSEIDRVVWVIEATIVDTARAMSSERMHIIVDLTGWTLFPCAEVMALRPAPVMVSWHGYAGTMGGIVDYLGVDRVVTPPEHQAHFSERMLFVRQSYLLSAAPRNIFQNLWVGRFSHKKRVQTPPQRNTLGTFLRETGSDLIWYDSDGRNTSISGWSDSDIILCSWNNIYKGDPHTLQIWMDVLRASPSTKLWLMLFDPAPPPNVALAAENNGVDPRRVVWSTFFSREVEFGVKSLPDIFLDWPNFNGHTTAAEAFWAGVPVVSTATDEFSGRVAASLLILGTGPGAPTLARNLDDYRDVTLRLTRRAGRDSVNAAAMISRKLKVMRADGGLMTSSTWVRSWESGLARAVDVALSGLPPHHLSPA